jgi:hypothetical protein
VGPGGGGLARRFSAGPAAHLLGGESTRLVAIAQLRDRQRAAIPVPPAAHAARAAGDGDIEHAPPRLVLSLAVGRVRDQGAQTRVHAHADPAAPARVAHGDRRLVEPRI